ncbi:MAG TPA: ZIP family metal transporter [Telluria sp.]
MLAFFTKKGVVTGASPRTTLRRTAGLATVLAGLLILLGHCVDAISAAGTTVQGAVMGGSLAAAATAIGTLPVFFAQKFSQRSYDSMLGFGAGVMLGATAFSLIVPALAAARSAGTSDALSSVTVGGGIVFGALLILGLDSLISANSTDLGERHSAKESVKHTWMFVAAVALHNLPEGLAIGVAYAGQDPGAARTLATAIAIQDVPEGLVVALALRSVGYGRMSAAALGAASGLVEPLAAGLGAVMIGLATNLLPLGLALAAGAMLFVIVHNVIPESHRNGHATFSSIALTIGFTLMTVLDTGIT